MLHHRVHVHLVELLMVSSITLSTFCYIIYISYLNYYLNISYIVHANPFVSPQILSNNPEGSTSVRKGKQIKMGQSIIHQLRRDISSDLNAADVETSKSKIFKNENYFIVKYYICFNI